MTTQFTSKADESNTNKKTGPIPRILVAGIGGAGNNTVARISSFPFSQINFAALNTDLQALENCPVNNRLQLGANLTGGFGAGADPHTGQAAALESREEIQALLTDADMAILTCGMGGGTGTGAIPVIAQLCQNAGILTLAVVTTPFSFEGQPRMNAAINGLAELRKYADTLLIISNDKLLELPEIAAEESFCLEEAFLRADTVLSQVIESIANIIYNTGTINLDFNDLKTVLRGKGIGHIGLGFANTEASIMEALEQALRSPLLDTSISGADTILINCAGNIELTDLNNALTHLRDLAGENVNIIWGTVTDRNTAKNQKSIILIATGMQKNITECAHVHSYKAKDISSPLPSSSGLKGTFRSAAEPLDIPILSSRVSPKSAIIPDFLSRYGKQKAD